MSGSYAATVRGWKGTVSWNICREGVRCPPLPSAARESVSLGNLFELDLAELRADAKAKLDGVLSKLQTDPGLRPEIRVMLKETYYTDPIFREVLAKARIEQLKAWFAEHGVDASRIDWTWEAGAGDQVMVSY